MSVAAHLHAAEHEPAVAGKGCGGVDDALGEEGEPLSGLEGGARGILSHDGAVEERFQGVFREAAVVLAALTSHHDARIVGGRRHHAEHLARLGLNGHDGAQLALHEPLAQPLQVDVDAQGEVLARYGLGVEASVLVVALYASAHIPEQYLHTLGAAQFLLVGALYADFSDIVAGLVVVVFLDVLGRHLRHIPQQQGRRGILILADASFLDVKAREFVGFLLKHAELLVGELRHEELLCVA